MRHLGSTLLTLWGAIFVPSLLVWGLMLRWSESAANRFETVWRWCADRLAFPLLLQQQTEWAWRTLDSGTPLQATTGFILLTLVWSLMLTVPLVVIIGWWQWLARRTASRPASYAFATDSDTSHALPPPPPPSPLGILYLITMPLALVWLGLRTLRRPFSGSHHPILTFLRPIALVSGLVFAIIAGWYCFAFSQVTYVEWQNELGRHFMYGVWYGWMETLHIPFFFNTQWHQALHETQLTTHVLGGPEAWAAHMDGWYRHAPLRHLIFFTALRPALGAAIVMTGIQIIRRLFT